MTGRELTGVWRLLAVLCLLLVTCASAVHATVPIPYTDEQLAHSPIVVIGYWPRAKRVRSDAYAHFEVRTRLVVTRVIHGDLKPGLYPMVYSGFIGWNDNGTGLNSHSDSLFMSFDIDVSKPTIWFLHWSKSSARADRARYLKPDQWRCIQQVSLLPFYEALRGPRPVAAVGELLDSRNSILVSQALEYLAGSYEPMPSTCFVDREGVTTLQKQPRELSRLLRLIHGPLVSCRAPAAALYAAMTGRSSLPLMRRLLANRDLKLRAVAAWNLMHAGDSTRLKEIARVVASFRKLRAPAEKDSSVYDRNRYRQIETECELLEEMGATGDVRYVPDLIRYLDDQTELYGSPFEKAHKSLAELTGYSFPYDVSRSLSAWTEISSSFGRPQWPAKLTEYLGDWREPLSAKASFVRDAKGRLTIVKRKDEEPGVAVQVTVTNQSARVLWIRQTPGDADADVTTKAGELVSSGSVTVPSSTVILILKPGESTKFRVILDRWSGSPGALTKITLHFGAPDAPGRTVNWVGDVACSIMAPS